MFLNFVFAIHFFFLLDVSNFDYWNFTVCKLDIQTHTEHLDFLYFICQIIKMFYQRNLNNYYLKFSPNTILWPKVSRANILFIANTRLACGLAPVGLLKVMHGYALHTKNTQLQWSNEKSNTFTLLNCLTSKKQAIKTKGKLDYMFVALMQQNTFLKDLLHLKTCNKQNSNNVMFTFFKGSDTQY